MPFTEKSESHSSRVGIMICVLLIVMLIEKLEAHHMLPVPITYSTEAASMDMDTVERDTITCMGCARLPMARIDVTGMVR